MVLFQAYGEKEDCSEQFIRNDSVEAPFTTMINKLVYGQKNELAAELEHL